MRTIGLLVFVSVCGAAALVSAPGCNTSCTEVGCTTGITASIAAGDVDALAGSYVEACREDECASGVINLEDGAISCEVADRDDFFTSCNVSAEGVVSFQVSLRTEDVEDEEEYRFTVRPPGAEDAVAQGTVAIEKTEINGSGCGYCYAGSL